MQLNILLYKQAERSNFIVPKLARSIFYNLFFADYVSSLLGSSEKYDILVWAWNMSDVRGPDV